MKGIALSILTSGFLIAVSIDPPIDQAGKDAVGWAMLVFVVLTFITLLAEKTTKQ